MKFLLSIILIFISIEAFSYPVGVNTTTGGKAYPSLIDFGFIKGTNTGSTTTINSLGASVGDSLALGGALGSSAIFDAQSTTKGFLPPRMTTTQKNAIASPAAGLTVFDTTLNVLSTYNGSLWLSAAQSSDTDWASYTATFTGWGTVSTQNLLWRRSGPNLEIKGSFVMGTPTAVEQRISFPSGPVSSSSLPTLSIAGVMAYGANLGSIVYSNYTLMEPSVSYFTIGFQASGTAGLSKNNTTSFLPASGTVISVIASIPIQGWSTNTGSFSGIAQVVGVGAPKLFSANITTTSGAVTNNMGSVIGTCTAANPTVCTLTGLTISPNCGVGNGTAAAQNTLITAKSSTSISISTASATQSFDLNCMGY